MLRVCFFTEYFQPFVYRIEVVCNPFRLNMSFTHIGNYMGMSYDIEQGGQPLVHFLSLVQIRIAWSVKN